MKRKAPFRNMPKRQAKKFARLRLVREGRRLTKRMKPNARAR